MSAINRTFYVVQNSKNEFLRSFDKELNQIVFTPNIEEARFYTHSRAIKTRIGERVMQVDVVLQREQIKLIGS